MVHLGQNLTVPCPIHKANDVMWVKETSEEHFEEKESHRMEVLEDGSLFLINVTRNDSGIYVCNRENVVHNEIKARVKVEVKSKYFLRIYFLNNDSPSLSLLKTRQIDYDLICLYLI